MANGIDTMNMYFMKWVVFHDILTIGENPIKQKYISVHIKYYYIFFVCLFVAPAFKCVIYTYLFEEKELTNVSI